MRKEKGRDSLSSPGWETLQTPWSPKGCLLPWSFLHFRKGKELLAHKRAGQGVSLYWGMTDCKILCIEGNYLGIMEISLACEWDPAPVCGFLGPCWEIRVSGSPHTEYMSSCLVCALVHHSWGLLESMGYVPIALCMIFVWPHTWMAALLWQWRLPRWCWEEVGLKGGSNVLMRVLIAWLTLAYLEE